MRYNAYLVSQRNGCVTEWGLSLRSTCRVRHVPLYMWSGTDFALLCINKIVRVSQKFDFSEKSNFYDGVNL